MRSLALPEVLGFDIKRPLSVHPHPWTGCPHRRARATWRNSCPKFTRADASTPPGSRRCAPCSQCAALALTLLRGLIRQVSSTPRGVCSYVSGDGSGASVWLAVILCSERQAHKVIRQGHRSVQHCQHGMHGRWSLLQRVQPAFLHACHSFLLTLETNTRE